MSYGAIATYQEEQASHYAIASLLDKAILDADPLYPQWHHFVSQRAITAIAIAPDTQQMWLATWGGVQSWHRQQEQGYRRYTSAHGLAGNATACIGVDAEGRAWAGGVEGELCYFEQGYWHIYSATPQGQALAGQCVRALCNAGVGRGLWVATSDAVYHLPGPTAPATLLAGRPASGAIDALALLTDGNDLLLGNAWGLFRIQPGAEPQPLASSTIECCTALARDANNQLWVAAPTALYTLAGDQVSKVYELDGTLPAARIMGLAAGQRRVWLLLTTGIGYLEAGQWTPTPWTESGGERPLFQTIAASSDDAYLWVGSDQGLWGLYSTPTAGTRWDGNLLAPHVDDALNNLCLSLAGSAADGKLWGGTAAGPVIFAGDEWSTTPLVCVPQGICLDAQQQVWILAWPQGLVKSSPSTPFALITAPAGAPVAVTAGHSGTVVCLTSRALWQWEKMHWKEVMAAPPAVPNCLVQSASEGWWLGADEGLFRQEGERWRQVDDPNGPQPSPIYALIVVDGALWVGGVMGLWSWDAHIWTAHPLAIDGKSLGVRALAPAGRSGKLWLACTDRIMRYDPATGQTDCTWTLTNSGLGSVRVTALLQTERHLWVTTQVGVCRVALP